MSYSKKLLNWNETRKSKQLKLPACKKKLPHNKAIVAVKNFVLSTVKNTLS